ncbi:hypothetical protein [Angustibacter aerolatus]
MPDDAEAADDAVEAAAEELYGLAPGDFTARRDELAKDAKTTGDRAAAKAIGAFRRPTVPAHLVNQLARGDELADLLEVGEALREAQSDLQGAQMRILTKQRQQVIAALVRRAGEVADEQDLKLTDAAAREVEQTLTASVADPAAEQAVASGRLTRALAYSGFGEVDITAATALPLPERAPRPKAEPALAPEPAPAKPAARRERALQVAPEPDPRAERLEQAERAATDAADDVARAKEAADDAERAATDAEQRVDDLTEQLRLAREERTAATRARDAAVRALRRAEREAREATSALRALRRRS